MKVRFGVCADVHTEFIHDSVERMEKFIKECEEKKVDFCIELGDFCPPGEMNQSHKGKILDMVKSCTVPFYHTFGNHDTDRNTKENIANYIGEGNTNCSFDAGGVHFVILDACHYLENGEYYSYNMGNYTKAAPDALVPVIPPSELERLKKELNCTEYPTVVFSHQSLIESRSGIMNAPMFREAIQGTKSKLLMAICGHEHVDRLECRDGVYYYCLNSMSYYWAGDKYSHTTYGEEIEARHPLLREVFPYKDPLYAIIEIDDNEIRIDGKLSEIVGEKPENMSFVKKGLTDPITASVISRTIPVSL